MCLATNFYFKICTIFDNYFSESVVKISSFLFLKSQSNTRACYRFFIKKAAFMMLILP
ncbi:hypothetical protein B6N60_03975 [Richelia sinica FACHB-800]|uniref:Uncharacterized protein n=1 Tax=Richelia sinica FACHB-800 TaxID=1357546 RepID=A0A975Y6G7_9NOST|nr:hypothetical protein B6N60_03975 [Richelia sinica FACHB-800]